MPMRTEYKTALATFYIRKYDVFLGIKIFGDIQKQFLVPLAAFLEARDTPGSQAGQQVNGHDLQLEAIMTGVEKLSKSLDGDSLVALIRKLLHEDYISVSIGGGEPRKLDEGLLNQSIEGLGDLIGLIVEIVKVNYSDLFTRSRDLIGQAQFSLGNR